MVLEAPGAGGATGAADGATNNANEEGDGGNAARGVNPPEVYLTTFYTGQLPAAIGAVAKAVATKQSLVGQREKAEALFQFLQTNGNDLRDLNSDDSLFTTLVAVPDSNRVKLVYGLGFGTAGIGRVSSVAGKLLALTGEGGGEIGPAQTMVLDASLKVKVTMKNITTAQVATVFGSGNQRVDQSVMKALDVHGESTIMKMAPIPPYLVYDGFEDDLDASMVYERVMDCQHDSPMRSNALEFLRTCMIGQWRTADIKPFLPAEQWHRMLPMEARLWAATQMKKILPELSLPPAPVTPPRGPPPAGGLQYTPQGGAGVGDNANQVAGGMIQMDAATLRDFLTKAPGQGAPTPVTPEEATFKVSAGEKARMRTMCGIADEAGDECLPKWFRDLFTKHQDDISKAQIIAEAVNASWILEDAEVPLYPSLIKSIRTRNWTAQDLGTKAALVHAASGLSPFAMIDLTEEDVAEMKLAHDDLTNATTVSASEYKAARAKLAPRTPVDSDGFMLMLKRYTNLLHALFTAMSPMYIQMYGIVKALKGYSRHAKERFSHEAMTSILWIILLQSRIYAQGKMEGDDACLGEFVNMVNQIKAKQVGSIKHDEVPTQLLNPPASKKRKEQSVVAQTECDKDTRETENVRGKRQKANKGGRIVQPYSKELLEFFKEPNGATGNPYLGQICKYCGTSPEQLVPDLGRDDCRNFVVLGGCKYGSSCRFNHKTASKRQVEKITNMLKRFKEEPLGLRGENH